MNSDTYQTSLSIIQPQHPKLERARVWCTVCGRSIKVNVAACFEYGWPKCCGYTMSLDSPEERGVKPNG